MRWIRTLLLACCTMTITQAQSLPPGPDSRLVELLQQSIVRVWWSRDLMSSGEYFRFALNGAVIENIMPRFQATYETDAWVYDDSAHVAAYLGPAGSWMHRGPLQLLVQTVNGECLPARLVGIDEAEGVAVIQAEATSLRPMPAQWNIHWKPYSRFYVASLDKGLNLIGCRLLNAHKQAGLAEHTLHFKKLRRGRPGSLVFTPEGEFAGFLTTVLKGPARIRDSVDLMPAEQVAASAQRIIRAGTNIPSGWLGLYLKDPPSPLPPGAAAGVIVRRVVSGGPGEKAGIMENDVILKVNDIAAQSVSHVVRLIQRSPLASALRLEISRGDRTLLLKPTVGMRENAEKQPTYVVEQNEKRTFRVRRADPLGMMKSRNAIFLGIYTSDQAGSPDSRGLLITDIVDNTPAAQAGLKKGDVILQVNDMTVQNIDQYVAALMKNLAAPRITFRFRRDQNEILKTLSLR
ncbi:MAG: PDZ domain-containing protein [Acidobacteria bacterium]|nr:PDZ domain-containing protein [Acidobacteriota bacterium]